MRSDNQNKRMEEELSILNSNSTQFSEEMAAEPTARPKGKAIVAIALVILLLAGIFVGGGIISEVQYQKQVAEEEAQEIRDGEEIKYLQEVPEEKDGEFQSGITALYYTQENGLMVGMIFVNGKDAAVSVEQVSVTVRNEKDEVIASAQAKLKNITVASKESVEHNLYIKPNLVKITDSALDTLTYEIEVVEDEAA